MIYILVALKAEAQAFVDKYKLKNYKNENLVVFISGIGSNAMEQKTKYVLKNFKDNDKIINVGICGASDKYSIGQLIDARFHNISCSDKDVSCNSIYEIVDMESSGFLKATKDIKNRFVFKIVSDHFEPQKVTKDKAKQLIFKQIDEIMTRVENA
jgi:nucleoside phosphorylase